MAAEVFVGHRGERFESALNDSLGAEVDPTPGSHLSVHHQATAFEFMEVFPVGPGADEIRIGDQHSRRVFVRAKNRDRLAGLDQQGFIVFQRAQFTHNRVERWPVSRCLTSTPINDQLIRLLRDIGIEIVHEATQRGLLVPTFARQLRAMRCPDHSVFAHAHPWAGLLRAAPPATNTPLLRGPPPGRSPPVRALSPPLLPPTPTPQLKTPPPAWARGPPQPGPRMSM